MLLILLVLFVAGACIGAIVNLGIYRLAYFRRRISPWSRSGRAPLNRNWLDRIPIFGWWSLRREAKVHGAVFWIRPMFIELCFALGVAALYWFEVEKAALNISPQWPGLRPVGPQFAAVLASQFAIHVVLLAFMAVATFIDIDEQTIPDSITVPGTLLALIFAVVCTSPALPSLLVDVQQPAAEQLVAPLRFDYPNDATAFLRSAEALHLALANYLAWCFALLPRRWRSGVGMAKAWRVMWRRIFARPDWKWVLPLAVFGTLGIIFVWLPGGENWRGLFSALMGMAAGGGIIWMIRLIGGAVLKREAMGFGDVTLMAMIGAFLGWQAVLIVFFLSPFAALALGLLRWLLKGSNVIPFGPFLCLAALVVLIFWAPIWDYASRMFEIPWLVPSAIVVCAPLLAILLYGWMFIRGRFLPE